MSIGAMHNLRVFSQLYLTFHHFLFLPNRNGGGHKSRGFHGCGARCGGKELALGGVQECHRSAASLLAHHLLHRAEGGEQRWWREAGNDQKLQDTGVYVQVWEREGEANVVHQRGWTTDKNILSVDCDLSIHEISFKRTCWNMQKMNCKAYGRNGIKLIWYTFTLSWLSLVLIKSS